MINHPLLLAAVPDELAGLAKQPPCGWQVRCTGIGAMAAAIATTKYLMTMSPSKVIFVGTCGAYDMRLAIGDILIVSQVLSISLDIIDGRMYRPEQELCNWPATLKLRPSLPVPKFSVAVTPGITKTLCGANKLAAVAAVEHLELASVFASCHTIGVPCGAILTVANQVGPKAHMQWRANHKQVSKALIDMLMANEVFND